MTDHSSAPTEGKGDRQAATLEFRDATKRALTDNQAAIFQSMVPTVIPFLRTRAFDTAK